MFNFNKEQKKLWKLIQKGRHDDVKSFLETLSENAAILLNKRHKSSGDSVIHLACRHGFLPIVKHFHETWTIALTLRNLDDKTPLHEASAAGHSDIVLYLLERGVDVDPLKISDWTPLMLACAKEFNLPVVQLLTHNAANVHLMNKDGWNCFHIACRTGDVGMVKYLFEVDSSLSITTSNNGRTPLHTAAMHGRKDTLEFLVEYCSSRLNVQDSCGSTPLMDAVKGNHLSLCRFIVKNGGNKIIYAEDCLGRTVLHIAAECGRVEFIEYFVRECSMDPNIKSNTTDLNVKSHTPLAWARKENQFYAIEILKQLGSIV